VLIELGSNVVASLIVAVPALAINVWLALRPESFIARLKERRERPWNPTVIRAIAIIACFLICFTLFKMLITSQ